MSDIEKNSYNWTGPPIVFESSEKVETSKPTVVDLFSGPGGISEGLKLAGFCPVLGSDIHEVSIDTYQRNNPQAHTILGDIKKLTSNERYDTREPLMSIINQDTYGETSRLQKVYERLSVDSIDLLTGGIPCQGFSLANKKQDDEDERNYLFEEMIRATKILNPEIILLENVSTMKAAKDGKFIEDIHTCFSELGYHSDHTVLLASNYGVPQDRKRLFFIASRSDQPIVWPEETTPEEQITVENALSDLAELQPAESATTYRCDPQNNYQKRMRKNCTAYTNHTAPRHQQQTITRIKNTTPGDPMYNNFRQRIRLQNNKPSPTIVSGGIRPQFQLGHPSQNRGLTVRERARLQSFPDSFVFEGGVTQGRVQTGMAVPPLLAEQLGNTIKTLL